MKSIENTAERIALYLNENVEGASSVAVLRFSIIVILNFLFVCAFVFLVTSITGHMLQAITVLFVSSLFRYVSGGLHFKSALLCNIISSAIFLIAIYQTFSYQYFGLFLNFLALLIVLAYAPHDIRNKSRINEKYYPFLKLLSLCIVSTNFYFQSSLLATLFLLQALTMLPIMLKMVNKYNW